MTFVQAIIIAILQGVSELFPVSSLGHAVLVPALFHWSINREDPTFLAFIVVLHLGTAIALLVFYRRDWIEIIGAFFRSIARGRVTDAPDERLAWLIVAGSIPVGLLGVFLETPVRKLFGSTAIVSIFLIINAGIMFYGEYLRDRAVRNSRVLTRMPWQDGVKIGFAQSLALLPGISRSGASITAGLLLKLTHDDAARYSFLLATPVIFAASVLEIPRLFLPTVHLALSESIVGGIVAGITAYLSVAFLTRYFHGNTLRPFGWYCLALGSLSLLLYVLKVIA